MYTYVLPPPPPLNCASESAPVPAGAHRAMWYLNIYAAISGAQVIIAPLNSCPRVRTSTHAGWESLRSNGAALFNCCCDGRFNLPSAEACMPWLCDRCADCGHGRSLPAPTQTVVEFVRGFACNFLAVRAARHLHNGMLARLLRCAPGRLPRTARL